MSRVQDRNGTKLSAKTNPNKNHGAGPRVFGSRFGSWKGRRYGRSLRRPRA